MTTQTDKPGIKTTEFWITLGLQLVGVLVLTGMLGFTPEQQQQLADQAQAVATQGSGVWSAARDIVVVLVMGWQGGRYGAQRTRIKLGDS